MLAVLLVLAGVKEPVAPAGLGSNYVTHGDTRTVSLYSLSGERECSYPSGRNYSCSEITATHPLVTKLFKCMNCELWMGEAGDVTSPRRPASTAHFCAKDGSEAVQVGYLNTDCQAGPSVEFHYDRPGTAQSPGCELGQGCSKTPPDPYCTNDGRCQCDHSKPPCGCCHLVEKEDTTAAKVWWVVE